MLVDKKLIKTFKYKFMSFPIKYKVITIFMLFLVIYFFTTTILYKKILEQEKTKQLNLSSSQSIYLMKSNIESNIENVNSISKLIISNENVRAYLNSKDSGLRYKRSVHQTFSQLFVTFPFIDSIYLYRFNGTNISVSKSVTFCLNNDISSTSWYNQVLGLEGKYLININAGGNLVPNTGKNNVSMIRVVYDIDKLVPTGILIINITEDFFSPIIEETKLKYNTSFILLDHNEQPIIIGNQSDPIISSLKEEYTHGVIETINDVEYYVLCSSLDDYNWKLVSYTPIDTINQTINPFNSFLVLLITISVIVFLTASLFTANFVTKPINKLITAMQGVKKGHFKPVTILTGYDEIGELKNTYNLMIEEIEKMIIKEVSTEKQKRKLELSILNEQIKPHFLYNTLDNISYLALSHNNKEVYDAIHALGQFYRESLNKGNAMTTLEAEIAMIKNYLTLQKLRYHTLINDTYHLEEETLNIPILKNILQPLVENCIYHGIKPSGESGTIIISSKLKNNRLYISIEDDGLGMTKETMLSLQANYIDENTKSFGLRGTIARLKIHYNIDDVYEVKSERFKGTQIILKLPFQEVTYESKSSQSTYSR